MRRDPDSLIQYPWTAGTLTVEGDNDGTGGGGTPNLSPPTPPAGTTPPTGTTPGTQTPPPATEAKFTQADLDAAVQKAIGGKLGQLRQKYGDLDELHTAAQKAKDLESANETEVTKLRKENEQLKAATSELGGKVKALTLRTSVGEYLGEHHPDYRGREKWIIPHVTLDGVTEGDDAALSKAVKVAVDEYVKANPIAPKGAGSPAGPGRQGSPTNGKDLGQALAGAMFQSGPMVQGRIPSFLQPFVQGQPQEQQQ